MLLTQEKWPEFVRRDEQFGPSFSFQPVLISPLSKKLIAQTQIKFCCKTQIKQRRHGQMNSVQRYLFNNVLSVTKYTLDLHNKVKQYFSEVTKWNWGHLCRKIFSLNCDMI